MTEGTPVSLYFSTCSFSKVDLPLLEFRPRTLSLGEEQIIDFLCEEQGFGGGLGIDVQGQNPKVYGKLIVKRWILKVKRL